MPMKNLIKRFLTGAPAPESPPPRVHSVVANQNVFDKQAGRALGLRRNMWVMSPVYGVGILQALSPDAVGQVMLIDDNGDNRMPVIVQANSLRQALHAEIPGPRRPDATTAAKFGYT